MSRASSVPVFSVEISAPWTNGTASANARKVFAGKPGRCVDAASPAELTANSASGKPSGAITYAGWRTIRTVERHVRWAICRLSTRGLGLDRLRLGLRLGLGALAMATGLLEGDVVERRRVELEMGDLDLLGVERAHDLREPGLAHL